MDTFYTRQSFLLLFIFLQCDWLLGDRKTRAQDDEQEGLDPSSQKYKALVSNPNVQLGLNNPRCLLGNL